MTALFSDLAPSHNRSALSFLTKSGIAASLSNCVTQLVVEADARMQSDRLSCCQTSYSFRLFPDWALMQNLCCLIVILSVASYTSDVLHSQMATPSACVLSGFKFWSIALEQGSVVKCVLFVWAFVATRLCCTAAPALHYIRCNK